MHGRYSPFESCNLIQYESVRISALIFQKESSRVNKLEISFSKYIGWLVVDGNIPLQCAFPLLFRHPAENAPVRLQSLTPPSTCVYCLPAFASMHFACAVTPPNKLASSYAFMWMLGSYQLLDQKYTWTASLYYSSMQNSNHRPH
jgi:hypothetical protein